MNRRNAIRTMTALALVLCAAKLMAQTTATGTINAKLVHKNGIALVFNTDPAGVTLGASGTAAATANFGTISAFGPLSPGVTRPSLTATSFTVRTVFDVQVTQGGLTSTSYTLTANLQTVAPKGFTYVVDGVTLGVGTLTIQTNGAYDANVPHNLDLVVLTAAPAAGGPAVGTPQTETLNFTATAN